MDFNLEYVNRIGAIDSYIEDYLDGLEGVEPLLKEGMKYAVLNGGKRLRSILCTEICFSVSGSIEASLPFATAIEFIHAYSLVHDDLPAMDNADLRRGKPSCHKKYGEDIAILIGDALLNTAYELMLRYVEDTDNGILAMRAIAGASGIFGMVNGQMQDLRLSESKSITEVDLTRLIEQKTMALIRGAAVAGALIGGCDSKTAEYVDKYAYHLGLAFQIRDDFEDFEEDEAEEHSCPNFINILGKEDAKKMFRYNVDESDKYLGMIKNNDFLRELNNFLFSEVK